MADTQPQLQFNEDALRGVIQQAVRETVSAEAQASRAAQAAAAEQRRAAEEAAQAAQARNQFGQWAADDPVARTVLPVVAPLLQEQNRLLQQNGLQTALAQDETRFYRSHPEAHRYEPQIEQVMQNALRKGMPIDRQTAWAQLRGQNFEHFAQELNRERWEAQQRAQAGFVLGPTGLQRDMGRVLNTDPNAPLEAQKKGLEGLVF